MELYNSYSVQQGVHIFCLSLKLSDKFLTLVVQHGKSKPNILPYIFPLLVL